MLDVVSKASNAQANPADGGGSHLRSAGTEQSTASGCSAYAEAASLGISALAGAVAGAQDGITVVDAQRRIVYANPAACEMLGYTLEQLRSRDFLASIPAREHTIILDRFSEQMGGSTRAVPAPFTCNLVGPDGAEREIVYSTFVVDVAGNPHLVAIFQDLTGPRAAGRAAAALAQTTAQLVGPGTYEIMSGIARHAVEGTRALACGIDVMDDDHKLAPAGGYGFPSRIRTREARSAMQITLADLTGGAIVLDSVPGKPVVRPDARSAWEADPVIGPFAATIEALDWQGSVYVPLSWDSRVFGFLCVYLPSWLAGPSEEELVFYTALADQGAVAVTNARLAHQATQAAASLERSRLARELHDSVSQGLFSMMMHARAAQLAMEQAGLDASGSLARAIAELAELTRGALAEMRALIFELRPAALAEEGLVAAVRTQAAALAAREETVITVQGPEERLELSAGVEEHLYRIVSEALHNVVNHARAESATVSLTEQAGDLRVEVSDDGAGFDPDREHPGHLGLSTMAERAATIGAELAVTTTLGKGTTVALSLLDPPRDHGKAGQVRSDRTGEANVQASDWEPSATEKPAISGDREQPGQGEAGGPGRMVPDRTGSPVPADAAALGVPTLAGILAGAQEGITVCDANRRFVYANPAACEMLGHSLEQLKGQDFLSIIPPQEHSFALGRFSERLGRSVGEAAAPFRGMLMDRDGAAREIVASTFAIEIAGRHHGVTFFRDVTGTRAAARTAMALAQAASQLVGAGSTDEILAGLARHAVESTRALSCGITIAGDDHKLASAGAYGPDGPGYGEANPAWIALADAPVERVIEAMTLGRIVLGDAPGKPVVIPDARAVWEANPLTRPFAVNLSTVEWRAGVFLPLSWQNHIFGFFAIFLPAGLAGPSEEDLAFYTALADQAAVAAANARLTSHARQAATSLERARLARELHASVSQALFSMTMHARAAQLAMARSGLDESGRLGRSIAELAELTRGALADMRALIFELRPAALAEEGLIAALRKQAAALAAREQTTITVDGPEQRLDLEARVEEHLYRIVSEALHNVVNHAHADNASVSVTDAAGSLRVAVQDDGAGFDLESEHPGHLGLSTMAERAETIGAQLAVSSTSGDGTTVVVSLAHDRRDQGRGARDAG